MDTIVGSNPVSEARDALAKLKLLGGHDRLIAKLEDLLNRAMGTKLHGGELLKLQNLTAQVNEISK